ncbi:domon domain-containing protein frrs1l-like [Plakobranchus ocellatus]|uniref:Domon domain-containing protein frrs1l-like n=1 Tax=Plakobranchus ocellatus TaxID=259542 RepID=A0AAV4A0E0_9GAST|nr:domon domain-containing protein frrs1l-like [Plakobranchus ocellatus]
MVPTGPNGADLFTSQTLLLGGSLAKSPDCGSSKGCFSQCDSDSSCTFTVSWSLDSATDTATYTINSDVGASASWSAIGFSTDGKMGDDDVIGCLGLTDGSVRAFSAETTGRSTPEIYTDNSLVLVSGSVEDGTLTCTLRRPVASYSVGSRTRRDIGEPWTLFFARGSGSLSNNVISISYHSGNGRFKSSQALSARATVDDSAVDEKFPLIKAHGTPHPLLTEYVSC